MGILNRMKTLIKSNVNDLASKAEDPEKILNQLILDMQEQLGEAKIQVRDTIADKKMLKKQLDAATEKAADWEKKAMLAVEAGRDDLAREALSRKQEKEQEAATLQDSYERLAANADQLADQLRQLSTKIDEAKRKKESLVARAKRVEAKNQMATTGNAISNNNAFDAFERNAEKIEEFEIQVEASGELSGSVQEQELEAKFSKLEKGSAMDDELAALKAKMGFKE